MKIQAPGGRYDWRKFFSDLVVTLDGVQVDGINEADDEAGYVVRVVLDARGRRSLERSEGAVVIAGTPRQPAYDRMVAASQRRSRRRARNLREQNRREVGAARPTGGAAC
jgi:hypothetical protein